MSIILRDVDQVTFIIRAKQKLEAENNQIDLILLQKSGQMIFPSFQTKKIPANIPVKTEQQFQSYCRYFLSNFVFHNLPALELTWERQGSEIFVFSTIETTKPKQLYYFVTPAEILNQKHYLGTHVSETVSNFLSTKLKQVLEAEVFPQVFYLQVEEGDTIYFQNLPLERNQDGYFCFSSEIDQAKINLRYVVFVGKYGFDKFEENIDTCFLERTVLVKSRKQFSLLF
jgi:hypothetical protein